MTPSHNSTHAFLPLPPLGEGWDGGMHQENTVRLSPQQIQTIKQIGQDILGQDSRVLLFGSRVSDHMLGGDIDLMFESAHVVKRPAATICELYGALVMRLGEQKIDILIKDPSTPMEPVVQRALSTGVVL